MFIGMGLSLTRSGAAGGAAALWADAFADTDPNPLAARSGYTIADTGGNLSTEGGFLVAAGAGANWGDTSIYRTASSARSALGAVGAVFRFPVNAGGVGLFLTSALNPANPLTADRGMYYNYPDLRVAGVTANTLQAPGTRLYMIDYLFAIFVRPSGGAVYAVSGGQFGAWPAATIVWVDDDDATTPVYAGIANGSGVQRVDYWKGLAPASAGAFASRRFGNALAGYSFDTATGNASGYVSEEGAKALTVWTGAAEVVAGKLRSTGGTMRARCTPASQPRIWRATFTTPATVTGGEIYLDFRDNGTSRISAVLDTSAAYLFDGYAASTLASTGLALAGSTTYRLTVFDYNGEIRFYVDDVLRVTASTANGAGVATGGVTTVGVISQVDELVAYPASVTLPSALGTPIAIPAGTGAATISDPFTNTAATAIATHNAAWSNQAYSGGATPTFVIDSTGTKARQSGASDIGGFAVRAGGLGADHYAQADITIPTLDTGGFHGAVVCRWADNANYIAARFLNQGAADEIEVWQHIANVATLVVAIQLGNLTNGATHTLGLAVKGAQVAAYLNGAVVGQGVTALLTGTSVGFGLEDNPVTGKTDFDNFTVKAVA